MALRGKSRTSSPRSGVGRGPGPSPGCSPSTSPSTSSSAMASIVHHERRRGNRTDARPSRRRDRCDRGGGRRGAGRSRGRGGGPRSSGVVRWRSGHLGRDDVAYVDREARAARARAGDEVEAREGRDEGAPAPGAVPRGCEFAVLAGEAGGLGGRSGAGGGRGRGPGRRRGRGSGCGVHTCPFGSPGDPVSNFFWKRPWTPGRVGRALTRLFSPPRSVPGACDRIVRTMRKA